LLVNELFKTGWDRKPSALLLRGLHFAIVDEADSVLIDEGRTPLILSGIEADLDSEAGLYEDALDIARRLARHEDYHVLANEKAIRLTPAGERSLAQLAAGRKGLWAIRRAREELVQQALSAIHLFQRDVQYIVHEGKVQIVDEYTGRVMPDRSWQHGLHQLIEAKENCAITERHRTLERITYQRFFPRYLHLCGMTGTASEAAGELRAVYGLRIVSDTDQSPVAQSKLWYAHISNCGAEMERCRPLGNHSHPRQPGRVGWHTVGRCIRACGRATCQSRAAASHPERAPGPRGGRDCRRRWTARPRHSCD
jgi:preprotein translocase subunit SecA